TINHILSFSPPSGFNKGVDNVIINLQSNTYDQDSIKLNSGTILSNILTVQSNGYTPSSSSSTKQSIITSSNSQSLFSIANTGHLKLFGLHFDNLLSDSTNTLIYLISQSYDIVNPQVLIRDCAFEQSIPITYSVTHPLIRIQGGKLTIENTLIQNYEFTNGGKVIQLDSQTEKQYSIDIINTEFRNIAQDVGSGQGGAVISGNIDSINPLRIRDKTLFNNITSTGQGGCIYLSGWEGTIELSRVTFIQCRGMNGGSIYLYLEGGSSITIEECEFKGCESIGNNKDYGGAIFMGIYMSSCWFSIRNTIFTDCKGNNNNEGGAILVKANAGNTGIIDGVQFKDCQSNRGGSICGIIRQVDFLIENAQFESCSSNSDGGSIFAQIDDGRLRIRKVSFIGSSCNQSGSGGAISVVQLNLNSRISITDSSFMNCKTLPGSQNSFGWGGAIHISTSIPAISLSSNNFLLSDLSFSGCFAVNQIGNNIHVRSPNTIATGEAIQSYNLLTVNGTTNLYYNSNYKFEYMGIDESKVGDGTIINNHVPLFQSLFLTYQDPYYVNGNSGSNKSNCGSSNKPCLTINQILNLDRNIIINYPKSPIINIELQTDAPLENEIIIDSDTPIGNQIKIRSNSLKVDGTINTDYSVILIDQDGKFLISAGSLSFEKITFNINQNAANGFVIEGITESANININDCLMKMVRNSEGYSISTGLIEMSSGNINIDNLEVKDIIISNRSVIKVNEGVGQVSILNSNFSNIHKIGERNGGIIELSQNIRTSNEEQQMNVRIESSSFIQPISTSSTIIATSSPFIHASIGKLEIVQCSFVQEDESSQLGATAVSIEAGCSYLNISKTIFARLISGGISLESGQGSVAFIEDCQFLNCGDGSSIAGAVYVVGVPGDNLGSVSITGSQFISCKGSQAGGIMFGDNVIPFNVKNNFFFKNSVSNEKGAKDVYFLSKEILDKSGGIEVIAEGYRYDKSGSYIGEVKISGFDANFAQYLDCKTQGREDCGIIPCGGAKDQTVESCKQIIKEDEEEEIKDKKSKLSGGAIAGIVIAVVVVVTAIVVAIVLIIIYNKEHNSSSKKHKGSSHEMDTNQW
ncbi:MAG: hypothetical protein EZS28_008554, partial [Streblomastix strix]